MRVVVTLITTLFLAMNLWGRAWGAEVEGVVVPDSVVVAGKELKLNGAGVRTKLFFDIYVGALYLESRATTAGQVLSVKGPKRISMAMLYGEVSRGKLIDGWNQGFTKNQPKKAMAKLRPRLERFNALFTDAHKGDLLIYDFLEDGSTVVTFNGKQAGVIEGTDFQKALVEVWLGTYPAHNGLKRAMLSGGGK